MGPFLIIFLFRDPQLMEGSQWSENGTANPCRKPGCIHQNTVDRFWFCLPQLLDLLALLTWLTVLQTIFCMHLTEILSQFYTIYIKLIWDGCGHLRSAFTPLAMILIFCEGSVSANSLCTRTWGRHQSADSNHHHNHQKAHSTRPQTEILCHMDSKLGNAWRHDQIFFNAPTTKTSSTNSSGCHAIWYCSYLSTGSWNKKLSRQLTHSNRPKLTTAKNKAVRTLSKTWNMRARLSTSYSGMRAATSRPSKSDPPPVRTIEEKRSRLRSGSHLPTDSLNICTKPIALPASWEWAAATTCKHNTRYRSLAFLEVDMKWFVCRWLPMPWHVFSCVQ